MSYRFNISSKDNLSVQKSLPILQNSNSFKMEDTEILKLINAKKDKFKKAIDTK